MRHFMLMLLCFVSNDVLLSQQPPRSIKFETVAELVADQEFVRNEKLKFYKSSDPNGRYTLGMHQLLWDENIKFSLPFKHRDSQRKADGVDDNFKIDAFGMSTTKLIHEKQPELATDLMRRIHGEVVGKSIDFAELFDLIRKLKRELDAEWARSTQKEFDALILRAGLTNHLSRVSNKDECWLLVEVFHTKRNSNDLFVCDYMDKLLRSRKRGSERYESVSNDALFYPSIHPMVQESRFLDKNRRPKKDRNVPQVTVHSDLLTISEREALIGFELIDNTERKFHQIEGCYWASIDDARALKAMSDASSLLSDRVPDGSYLSFDELHLRLGSVAIILQKRFPEYKLIVTIKEVKINNLDYSKLHLEVKRLD
jgi:hypothetical protein